MSSHRRSLSILSTALFAAAASIGAPAHAHGAALDDTTQSVTVRFADLDLTRPAGVATLHARLRTAARSVCGPVEGYWAYEKTAWRHCVERAFDTALAKVEAARGSALLVGSKPAADIHALR